MFALSTEQITIPKLIDRNGIGSSFSKSSVAEVLTKMKDLQLDAIGTVASHGNIRVVGPDDFEVGYEAVEGPNTDKKIGAVFQMVFSAPKLAELIEQVEKRLDGNQEGDFSLLAITQYINRDIRIFLFTDEEKNGRRVVRKVKAAMPITQDDIDLGQNTNDTDLERLLAHMGVLRQVVMKLSNLSVEETLILIAVLDNLFCHTPNDNVLKSNQASCGEFLVRLMYTVELVKINRLAVVNVTELGGESHKKAVKDAVRLHEAVTKRLQQETDTTSNAPVDEDVLRGDPKGLDKILYLLQSKIETMTTAFTTMYTQQNQTTQQEE